MLKRDINSRGYVPYYEHAKIIAIVDKQGEVLGYDFTVTENVCDFFADPDDRKKYAAITVKSVPCDEIDEIKGKLSVAEKYLRLGQYMATKGKQELKRLVSDKTYEKSYEKDYGLLMPDFPLRRPWSVSPLARDRLVMWPKLLQVNDQNDQMTADYKLGDVVCLREGNLKFQATILACHDDGVEHVFIGTRGDEDMLVGFNPKHVIEHLPAKRFEDMTPVERAKWFTSGSAESDSSDSDSDIDLKIRLPYRTTISGCSRPGMTNLIPRLLEKIRLERQSDADLPESEPKPEQSDVVAPVAEAEQAAAKQACFAPPPLECIVPPRAPRHRRR